MNWAVYVSITFVDYAKRLGGTLSVNSRELRRTTTFWIGTIGERVSEGTKVVG